MISSSSSSTTHLKSLVLGLVVLLSSNLEVVQSQMRPGSVPGGLGSTFGGNVAATGEADDANSGYENNAATCEALADTPAKQLTNFWYSTQEALYTIGAEDYFDQIPFEPCQPPRRATPQDPNPLVGAWYSIKIPTPTTSIESSLTFQTTIKTDKTTNDPNRHHYISVLSSNNNDDCSGGLTCLAYAYSAYWEGTALLEASVSFQLETDKTYFVFVAFADNGNMDAPDIGITPTCDDSLTLDLFRVAYGDAELRKYCEPDRGFSLLGSGGGVVSTPMQLGNTGSETQDFTLTVLQPFKMFTTSLVGQVGTLTCRLDPDRDNGNADLFVGLDKTPNENDYSCASVRPGSSREECSLWIDGTSSQLSVWVQGTANDIELSCWVDSRGTEIDVGINMASDLFTLAEGEIKLYHIDAPQDAWTVSCSGNNDGMHILMKDKDMPSLGDLTTTTTGAGTAAPWETSGSCNATGTDRCEIATDMAGGDVIIMVEGIAPPSASSVLRRQGASTVRTGNQLNCEVVMNPSRSPINLDRATSINLDQDRGFDLLMNQKGLYKVRVPPRATRVSCNVWGSNAAIPYGLSVDPDPTRGEENPIMMDNCQTGQDCDYTFEGGMTPRSTDVYLGVVASSAAFVANMRCRADVASRSQIEVGIDMKSETFTLQDGEMRLFYFDAPTGMEHVKCKGNQANMGVHMKDRTFPVLGSDTDCDATGTNNCEVWASGGNEINILVQANGAVSNGEIRCEIYLDTTRQDDYDSGDAVDLNLDDEVEFDLLGNEVALFRTRVPQTRTSVTCRVWSTVSNAPEFKYEMSVSEPNQGTPSMPNARFGSCQATSNNIGCKKEWPGGNPEDPADVYVAATTNGPSRVRIRCNTEQVSASVDGDARFMTWGQEESGFDMNPGDSRLFYLIVPANANNFNCRTSASEGDLDLRVNQLERTFDTNCECRTGANCGLEPNNGALTPCNDCVGFGGDSNEQCSFTAAGRTSPSILYVEMKAFSQGTTTVRDARVTCEASGPGVSFRSGGSGGLNPIKVGINPDLAGLP